MERRKLLKSCLVIIFLVLMVGGCATTTRTDWDAKDFLYFTLNTEPQGARVYQDGNFLHTTPNSGGYWITQQNREYGYINTRPYIIVLDGYLPVKKEYRFDLDPPQKKNYNFADLIILERDPNAPRYYNQTQSSSQDITIRHQESTLDQIKKAGEIGIIFKTLKDMSRY